MQFVAAPDLIRPAACGLLFAAVALASSPAPAEEISVPRGFRFVPVNETSLALWDGPRPVLVYNHRVIRRENVPADRARSTYVHPLYGLDGEVLTDDFPADHYHHRGLFWAWPHVRVGDREYDLWMLRGIRHQFERWLARDTDWNAATLAVANGWYVGNENVVREAVRFCVHPITNDRRAIDVEFEWVPLTVPLTLTGAAGKSYGGLTLRYAPGTNTVITIPAGAVPEDLLMTNLPWADLTRRWDDGTRTSGAAIFVHPSHPDFPPQWMTRHYGVLCVGWPGVQSATFAVGKPIRCRFRLWIHRGAVTPDQLARAYADWARAEHAP